MLDNVLMGTYSHNMDIKGRMSFPNKLREIIGEKFVVTKGMDGCLFVYSIEAWEEFVAKVKAVPLAHGGKEMQRHFIAGATPVEADKQGRIMISQPLRDFAKLDKDVIVVGALNRCEIWDKAKWEKLNEEFNEFKLEEAMQALDF